MAADTRPPEEPESTTGTGRLRVKVEKANRWLSLSGHGIPGMGIFLFYWKKLGLVWTLPLVLLIAAPLGGYSALVYTSSRIIPDWVGDFGVQFSAREWNVDVFALKVTARDVSIATDAASAPVLTADEIAFDGSVSTVLRGLFSPGGAYHHITVRGGRLQLEQARDGTWNWAGFLDAVPDDRRRAAFAGLYEIEGLFIEGVDVVYVEYVPSGASEGLAETTTATIHVDEVSGRILNLRQATTAGERPTSFELTARSAGGRVDVRGAAALFPAESFLVTVTLDAIAMPALARMIPTTRVLAVGGTVRGQIAIEQTAAERRCRADVVVTDLALSANPKMVTDRGEFTRVNQELAAFRMSGPYDACRAPDVAAAAATDAPHTLSAQMADFNVQTTESAPMGVRVLAALDQRRLAGVVGSKILEGIKDLGGGLKRVLGVGR